MGFGNVGWKYYLVIICWSAFFIPGMFSPDRIKICPSTKTSLTKIVVIYFFFPETAGLTLEEIAKNFGEEVAVDLTGATDEEKARLDHQLATGENDQSMSSQLEKETKPLSTDEAGQNMSKAE